MEKEGILFLWLEDQPENKPDIVEGIEWKYKCKIIFALNQKEFIEKLSNNNIALILLDLRLPDDNDSSDFENSINPDYGIESVEAFREIHNENFKTPIDVPIIVFSARFDDEARKKTAKLGISNYVMKPFTYTEVVNAINGALGIKGH